MRRKWVILMALVFLGVVGWVGSNIQSKSYNLGEVHRAVKGFGVKVVTNNVSEHIDPNSWKFYEPRAILYKVKTKFGKGVDNEYAETYRIQYPSNEVKVVVLWTFKKVLAVEVYPEHLPSPDAEGVMSEIRKRFPGLPCTIVAPSP